MATYPYDPAWYDNLGRRKGPTLGILYHMAEGGGTVGYLDKNGNPPPRGVSVHAVCEYSGRVVRMLDWADASGSLNPSDRSSDKAYYGHSTLVDVLGDWWRDPNSAVVSMEIEGFASSGPRLAQVAGAVAWGLDMRDRFPSIRGAIGHADQTDTKRCPGTSLSMKWIFSAVGGHGLFGQEDEVTDQFPVPTAPLLIAIANGAKLYDNSALLANDRTIIVNPGREMPLVGSMTAPASRIVEYVDDGGTHTGLAFWLAKADGGAMRPAGGDCAAQVAAATAPLNATIAQLRTDVANAHLAGQRAEWDRQEVGATVAVQLLPKP